MDSTGCPAKIAPELTVKYATELNWRPLFREDTQSSQILGRRQWLLDTMDKDVFNRYWEKAYDLMIKMKPEDRTSFLKDIKTYANAIAEQTKDVVWLDNSWTRWMIQAKRISSMLAIDKYDKELINNVKYIEDLFIDNGYQPYKIFQSMNKNIWLTDIYNNIWGSLRYAFMNQPWVSPSNLGEYLIWYAKWKGMSEVMANRFKSDMMWEALLTWARGNWIWGMKSMYSMLKYSPMTALVSGSLLLWNNTLLWLNLLFSKRRWIENLMRSKELDEVIDVTWMLSTETRAWQTMNNRFDQDGKNFFNKFMDWIFSKLPEWKATDKIRSIVQWWVHNLWDIWIENTVKRTAITEALAKNWIDAQNISIFLENIKNWNINPKFMNKLRADAMLNWTQFFTVWGISSLNRHKFSKRWLVNTLQWYVIWRASEVWQWISKFVKDMKTNPKRTRWEFSDYLMNDNIELKSLLNNILLAAKMWVYMDAMTEWHEWEDRERKVWRYVTNMSDYVSSFKSTFFYRLLTAPVRWIDNYYEYSDVIWKEPKLIEWLEVWMLQFLSEAFWMMFREWRVLNILSDSALAYIKTGNIDLTKDVIDIDLKKITDGMWRFSLLPWYDVFWQKWVESKDDLLWMLAFDYPEFNQAARMLSKVRDVSQVETFLNNKERAWTSILTNLPLISSFWKASQRNPSGQFPESTFNMLKNEIDTNPTMQKIRKWEFPLELLESKSIVKNLYNELTAHSYFGKGLDKDWKHFMSSSDKPYWLTQQEEEVFVMNIVEWLWITVQDFDNILRSNKKQSYLVKAMAAAEADMPGSSKIILWYLANQELHKQKQAIYWQKYSWAEVDRHIEDKLKWEIVEKLYPFMYFADKTAWYKLAREYMADSKPEIFWNIKNDAELTGFANSLWFLDLVYFSEANQWDVDAQYIKNIFNTVGKYQTDPNLRTKIVTHSLNTISWLESANESQKQMMRIWVLAANINHYDKLKKDPVASTLYADDIGKFESVIRWTIENLNQVWIDWMERDMWDLSKKQYYWSTGKKRTPNKNFSSNQAVTKQLMDWFNKMYNPAQNWRPEINEYRPTITESIIPRIATPKLFNLLYRIYDESYKAVSKNITEQTERKYPGQFMQTFKFDRPSYRKTRRYTSPGTKIPKWRKKYASQKTRKDLPGG